MRTLLQQLMEGNLPTRNMIQGISHGLLGLQHLHTSSLHHYHHHQQPPKYSHPEGLMVPPPMHDVLPLSANHTQECGQQPALSVKLPVTNYTKGKCGKTSMSDEDDPTLNTDDGVDGRNESGKGQQGSPWHRVKWTDEMVRLLITAVSYVGEDAASDCNSGGRRKFGILQKKGKWKSISKALAERGSYVSPQQCEDKFNDLNKRYKRLTDILGRGTSCKVVENPALLDLMQHLSDKDKDAARKILTSKHLFYEEMCSYHNGNRLYLPADPALQRSLQLVLRSRDDQGADSDDREYDAKENNTLSRDIRVSCFPKRMKQGAVSLDMNQVFPEGSNTDCVQKQWLRSRSLQLEEQRLDIRAQMMELENQRSKWQLFSKKKDRELDKMRMENEKMKLDNERLELELRYKGLEINLN